MASDRTRVAVLSATRVYAEALTTALHERGFDVVDEGADVVVVDSATGDARAALARHPRGRAVALSVAGDEAAILACLEAGFAGYAPADASLDELAAVVRAARRGELLCSPRISARLMRRVASLTPPPAEPPVAWLTPREREIVAMVDEGLSNKEIAARLSVAVPTVKTHIHNILEKLGARRRGEAAARLRSTTAL